MKISSVGKTSTITSEKKSINMKKDFSQNFNFQRERRNEAELRAMLDDIKKRGNRLVITKCYADVRAYKNLIKEYLQGVLKHMYEIKKDISFWQTQYFITVETIDNKLDELTNLLMNEQGENLDIASTIDEISGLVVDIYK
ncbi:MAG: YaaR family protein [Clostridiaceae bacterium]